MLLKTHRVDRTALCEAAMGPATRDRVKRGNENPPHPTQSDVRRSKRVTRSQSQGLDDDDSDSPPRSRPLRRGRQPSVELGDAKDSGTEKAKRSGRNKRKRRMLYLVTSSSLHLQVEFEFL